MLFNRANLDYTYSARRQEADDCSELASRQLDAGVTRSRSGIE